MRRLVAVALGLAALALGACGSEDDTDQGNAASCSDNERYSAQEVKEAVAPEHRVTPIYAVPKCPKEDYKLAFLNPGKNVPFFQSWSDGMRAAADFYGVELFETDLQLKYEDTLNQYQTVSVREPDAVGTLTTAGPALKARTDAAGVPLIPIDIPIEGNDHFHGIPNEKVGAMGGELLAEEAQGRLEDDWKGRNLLFVQVGDNTCEPCNIRVESALEAARETLDIADSNVVKLLRTEGLGDKAQTQMRDALTAHPDDVMLVIGINDGTGVGALQAAQAAGRTDDALVATLGADDQGRDALRNDRSGAFAGAVDFNPYAEGWTWVEAAIAVLEGEEFEPYEVDDIVTRENVDELYPSDKANR
jgi:ABC-type sugar transport system substrate-binding protein